MKIRPGIICLALAALTTLGSAKAANSGRTTTTVYVGRHFEVRNHDQPVKYVFNGDTRVARVTGSLSNNARIQRLRLQPGWNHCSVAVSDAALPGRTELDQVYRWNLGSSQYDSIGTQENLVAGDVLWIKANSPVVIGLSGSYAAPGATTWPAGESLVGGAGLEALSLALPAGVTIWKFDAASQNWRAGLAGDLSSINELPPKLAPGEAIYVHAAESIAAPLPDPAQQIACYHQDHLGSSSVTTDATGTLLGETAYYPFGAVRHEHSPGNFESHYGFTQKERDRESGLHYFEARSLAGSLARFISPDPKFLHPDTLSVEDRNGLLRQPQKLNPFAYVLNQPLNKIDPSGLDEKKPQPNSDRTDPARLMGPLQKTETILLLKESAADKPQPIAIESISHRLNFFGGGSSGHRQGRPTASEATLSKLNDSQSHKLASAAVTGKVYAEAIIIVRTQGPKSIVVMETKLSNVMVSTYQVDAGGDASQPREHFSFVFEGHSIRYNNPYTGENEVTHDTSTSSAPANPFQ